MTNSPATGLTRSLVIFINKLILFLARRWELLANGLFGLILVGAMLAPFLMSIGQPSAGQAIYRIYATQNHQLPQRSYFMFGPEGGFKTYSNTDLIMLGSLGSTGGQFIGNEKIGYKMALNHRMVAIFLGLLIGGILWSSTYMQPKIGYLSLTLLTLPMMLDAISHIISERAVYGLRDANLLIIWLTGNRFGANFYNDTSVGSLNWILRTVTGLMFGFATVWYLYPVLDRRFSAIRAELEPKLRRIGAID